MNIKCFLHWEKQFFYLAILGWHFHDKENLISSPCAQFVTHHMQKEMRKFEKFKFWLLKAKLIKRPGIENPIYQTILETFPSAIFSIFWKINTNCHFLWTWGGSLPPLSTILCWLSFPSRSLRRQQSTYKSTIWSYSPGKSPLFRDLKVAARPPPRQRSPAGHRAPLF